MKIRPFLPVLFLPLLGAADARTMVHAIEARYQHAKTLKATFFESVREGSGRPTAESGTVYFSRPGRMRWEYESPQNKLFLVDGTNAWFYIPADHTASRAKVKESSDWRTPIALLAGKANLDELCKQVQIIEPGAAKSDDEKVLAAGDSVLRCEPRQDGGDGGLRDILMEVNPQDFLVCVLIRETGNVQMEFRFGNWEENVAVPESQFHFQPPPGVSVVDQAEMENQLR